MGDHGASTSLNARSLSALVVDDSMVVGKHVTELLKELGFDPVDRALDAVHGLELLRSAMHRLVVADFEMEPMTGLDLLRAIRADWRLNETCFLMMTGATDFDHVSTAYTAGVDGYLLKPFGAAALDRKIREAFQHRDAALRVGTSARRGPEMLD